MRYFRISYYTTGGDFETRSKLIDEPTFRQYQKAMMDGSDFLILEDRVIKTSSVKEILPADEDVREYVAMGVPMAQLGLKELPKLESAAEETKKLEPVNFAKSLVEKSTLKT